MIDRRDHRDAIDALTQARDLVDDLAVSQELVSVVTLNKTALGLVEAALALLEAAASQ